MEIKNILEKGHFVEVKVYTEDECVSESEAKIKLWFENEENKGYTFLKCFKENGKLKTLFIKTKDLKKIIND